MSDGEQVLVVGAGVIGLTCAYYLQKAGYRVTLIDHDEVGQACSQANCGYICPSHVLPLTEPGALSNAFKSLFNPNAPFRVKPRLDPALWGWMLQFARRCRHEPMLKAGHALKTILDASMANYRELIAAESLDCEWCEDGLLYVLQHPAGMEDFARMDRLLTEEYGVTARRMDAAELQRFDPSFKPDLAGAFHYEDDATLRAERMNGSLRALLEKRGAMVVEHCPLRGVRKEGGRVVALETGQGEMTADHYVLAVGAWGAKWQNEFECKLPIQPGKGYSITLDEPDVMPKVSTLFPEHRVGITPYEKAVRLGSMMEFNGYDETLDERRLKLLRDSANVYLRDPIETPVQKSWYGWRPMTYDSLPIIGPAPRLANVTLALGHNMIGLTLAPATGRLVAEMISGADPHIDPTPYSAVRFN